MHTHAIRSRVLLLVLGLVLALAMGIGSAGALPDDDVDGADEAPQPTTDDDNDEAGDGVVLEDEVPQLDSSDDDEFDHHHQHQEHHQQQQQQQQQQKQKQDPTTTTKAKKNFTEVSPRMWRTYHVCGWLKSIDMGALCQTFKQNKVNGQMLVDLMDDHHLGQHGLGIRSEVLRERLLSEIGKLKDFSPWRVIKNKLLMRLMQPFTGLMMRTVAYGDDQREFEWYQRELERRAREYDRKRLKKDPRKWDVEDVCLWLEINGKPQLKLLVRSNQIHGDTLLDINNIQAVAHVLHVSPLRDRLSLLDDLRQLKVNMNPSWGQFFKRLLIGDLAPLIGAIIGTIVTVLGPWLLARSLRSYLYNFLLAPIFIILGYVAGSLVVIVTPLRGLVPMIAGIYMPILAYSTVSTRHRYLSEYIQNLEAEALQAQRDREIQRARRYASATALLGTEKPTDLFQWRIQEGVDIAKRKWEQTKYQANLGYRHVSHKGT